MNRTGSINNIVKSKPLSLTLIDILKPPPTPKSKEPNMIYRLLSSASVLPPVPAFWLLPFNFHPLSSPFYICLVPPLHLDSCPSIFILPLLLFAFVLPLPLHLDSCCICLALPMNLDSCSSIFILPLFLFASVLSLPLHLDSCPLIFISLHLAPCICLFSSWTIRQQLTSPHPFSLLAAEQKPEQKLNWTSFLAH